MLASFYFLPNKSSLCRFLVVLITFVMISPCFALIDQKPKCIIKTCHSYFLLENQSIRDQNQLYSVQGLGNAKLSSDNLIVISNFSSSQFDFNYVDRKDTTCLSATEEETNVSKACFNSVKSVIDEKCANLVDCIIDLSQEGDVPYTCATNTSNSLLIVKLSAIPISDPFQIVLILTVVLIGISMGASLKVDDVKIAVTKYYRALIVGFFTQILFMPALAFFFASVLNLGKLTAVSLIIVGSCPGGTASNFLTYLSHGNVAVSIILSSISILLSLGTLPLLLYLYVDLALKVDEKINIPNVNILITLVTAVIPPAFGMILTHCSAKIGKITERVGTVIGLLNLVLVAVLGIINNVEFFQLQNFPNLWIAAFLLQPIGCFFGYIVGLCFKFPKPTTRAISFEIGIQNLSLALLLISLSFKACERNEALSFPLIAGVVGVFNSLWIVLIFRYVLAPKDTLEEKRDRHNNLKSKNKETEKAEIFSDDEEEEEIKYDDDNINGTTFQIQETSSFRKNLELSEI